MDVSEPIILMQIRYYQEINSTSPKKFQINSFIVLLPYPSRRRSLSKLFVHIDLTLEYEKFSFEILSQALNKSKEISISIDEALKTSQIVKEFW